MQSGNTMITMSDMKSRKEVLYTLLASNELLQSIYSERDPVRLSDLKSQAKPLELELMDILNEENEVWLKAQATTNAVNEDIDYQQALDEIANREVINDEFIEDVINYLSDDSSDNIDFTDSFSK